jgi:serine/threonine protein kinase
MLTKSGAKLLDFGLAKAAAPVAQPSDLTSQPTELQNNLTQKGTILGTFQYMAPEQLERSETDALADVWALGCVLYEMATGKRAFAGKSQASLITATMGSEPPFILARPEPARSWRSFLPHQTRASSPSASVRDRRSFLPTRRGWRSRRSTRTARSRCGRAR